MARAMMQLDEQVKRDLESFKVKHRHDSGTLSDSVEYLLRYYAQNETQKIKDKEQAAKDEAKRRDTMIYLGDALKQKYIGFMESHGFKADSAGVFFLLHLYESLDHVPKSVFTSFVQTLTNRTSGNS